VRNGVLEAALPVEFPVMSLGETLLRRRDAFTATL